MKRIYKIAVSMFALAFMVSCDSGFDELNTNKVGTTSMDPVFVLNQAVINSSPFGASLNYEIGIVQQLISPNTGVLLGANFNQVNINSTNQAWIAGFQNVIRYTNDVITRTKDDAARSNLYSMARIVQANAYMQLTDTYGDVPYTEGGKGYTDGILFPKYDTQQSIYNSLINELTQASNNLDATKTVETGDVLFGGNVAKWKKFGFSLLLRAGMRLVKADPTKAQATAQAAFAGGVITTNADNAIIRHDTNFPNALGNTLTGTEAANFYLTEPFVNALKSTNDPRLGSIAVRYIGAGSGSAQVAAIADTTASKQFGLPVGTTDSQADALGKNLPSGGARYAFSQVDRTRMVKRNSPLFIVTAAQSNLLLAEAAARGWIGAPGSASTYFANGIRAHMDQMVDYDARSAVRASSRNKYVNDNPLDTSSLDASLSQINYQYWIASFLSPSEAWANFRRSGYPALAANPFPGRTVPFITRLTYPVSETLVNTANVQAAIASQGADALDTKVWWNK
ncbi:MAG TPA: SusD/RagB family nutrient-binding outer membrane lipoprotein [Cyclobacteriaceae bacterium]|nr:SusD/RagB family nutrient-binding outer membrane lipoprotein [Cyclobacteriaceae bacterium]